VQHLLHDISGILNKLSMMARVVRLPPERSFLAAQ
jgi:hypothetical protein